MLFVRSGVIWQVDKGKRRWKTLDNALNHLLEQAYQKKEIDIKQKDLSVREMTMSISLSFIIIIELSSYIRSYKLLDLSCLLEAFTLSMYMYYIYSL